MRIPAKVFKARCLDLISRVARTHEEVVITKHGKPVARLVPAREVPEAVIFGCMAGSVVKMGDIVSPVGDGWGAERF
jgi:prevent-host-death family protein